MLSTTVKVMGVDQRVCYEVREAKSGNSDKTLVLLHANPGSAEVAGTVPDGRMSQRTYTCSLV